MKLTPSTLSAFLLLGLSCAANAGEAPMLTPEPRVPVFHRDMPEHVMSRAIRRAAEEAFRAPITDSAGRVQYIVELAPQAAAAYRAAPPAR